MFFILYQLQLDYKSDTKPAVLKKQQSRVHTSTVRHLYTNGDHLAAVHINTDHPVGHSCYCHPSAESADTDSDVSDQPTCGTAD